MKIVSLVSIWTFVYIVICVFAERCIESSTIQFHVCIFFALTKKGTEKDYQSCLYERMLISWNEISGLWKADNFRLEPTLV